MSSVLSEYPEGLPAPSTGEVRPTERRKISGVGQIKNFRTVQRDRHGTRSYTFTFTPEQAAIFREWWVEWQQRGGGWFAANWVLPWGRGPHVFRFVDPPKWALIGGTITGQGYWRVSGQVEIRGRGMLPTVEVMYLTSTPYPLYSLDIVDAAVSADNKARESMHVMAPDSLGNWVSAEFTARNLHRELTYAESLQIGIVANITARTPFNKIDIPPETLDIAISANIIARVVIITHVIKPEAVSISIGATFNAS